MAMAVMRRRFRILPIPKKRRTRKTVIPIAAIMPLLVLANKAEIVKTRVVKRRRKKKGITPKLEGSIK